MQTSLYLLYNLFIDTYMYIVFVLVMVTSIVRFGRKRLLQWAASLFSLLFIFALICILSRTFLLYTVCTINYFLLASLSILSLLASLLNYFLSIVLFVAYGCFHSLGCSIPIIITLTYYV